MMMAKLMYHPRDNTVNNQISISIKHDELTMFPKISNMKACCWAILYVYSSRGLIEVIKESNDTHWILQKYSPSSLCTNELCIGKRPPV